MTMRKVSLCLTIVSVACLLALNSANAALIARYSLDSESGGTVPADFGGASYDATIVGNATISSVQSRFGGASAFFDDTIGSSIEAPRSPGETEDWSMSAWYWVDLDQGEGGFDGNWMSSRVDATSIGDASTSILALWYVHNSDNKLTFGSRVTPDDGTTLNWATEIVPIAEETTTHHREWVNVITLTDHDPVADTTNSKNYFNGVQVGVPAGVTQPGGPVQFAAGLPNQLIIGNAPSLTQEWKGYIDEVAYWDHLLLPGEIAALQTGVAPEPSTLALMAIGLLAYACRMRRR